MNHRYKDTDYKAKYYKKNKTRLSLKMKNWYADNKDKVLAKNKTVREERKRNKLCQGCGEPNQLWPKTMCVVCSGRRNEITRKIKLEVISAYGGCCSCCGEVEINFLSIDHPNNDGSKHRKTEAGSGKQFYRWLKVRGFPAGFRILCFNCNCARGFFGICPHEEKGLNIVQKISQLYNSKLIN